MKPIGGAVEGGNSINGIFWDVCRAISNQHRKREKAFKRSINKSNIVMNALLKKENHIHPCSCPSGGE